MWLGFNAFTSGWLFKRLQRLMRSSSSVLLGGLLALTVGTIIFLASLHYPYTLLTVHDSVSPDAILDPVCIRRDSNATLVTYDIRKPLERPNFDCIKTKTSPAVIVCLFDIWHDVYVSRSLWSAGIWEPYLVDEFIEAIRRGGPEAGVCDFCTFTSSSKLLSVFIVLAFRFHDLGKLVELIIIIE